MKKLLYLITVVLLLGIVASFVSLLTLPLDQAIAKTMFSPLVWLMALGAIVSWAFATHPSES